MKDSFVNFLIREKKRDIFHSSGYGKAQSGDKIGTTSSESFNERLKVDKNRQLIKRYNDSRVAAQRFNNSARAGRYVTPEAKDNFKKKFFGEKNHAEEKPKSIDNNQKSFVPPVRKTNFGK